MISEEITTKIYEFLYENCSADIYKAVNGESALVLDFSVFDRYDPITGEMLLENPDDVLGAMREAAKRIGEAPVNVRIKNLPERRNIRIRNLRAKHMGRMWCIDAVIKSATEVKPQIYEVIFECPDCHAKMVVKQESNIIQKPALCGPPFTESGCGRRGDFDVIGKKMYDVRWLTGVEPFEVTEGEQPGEIAVVIKEDLTTPKMQKMTDPGNRLKIVGILKEVPKRIKGKLSTKMDMMLEAVHLEFSETEFEDMEITPEDEQIIKDMAADPNIYDKLVASVAPGIYGFKEIKEAIVMQLFGGVPHVLADGSRVRGNVHILLTGDPGVGKSLVGQSKILHNSDKGPEFTDIGKLVDDVLREGRVVRINDSEVCFENRFGIKVASINPRTHEIEWKAVSAFIRHESPKSLLKVRTRSGREVIATKDHSFVKMDPNGDIIPVAGEELGKGCFLPVPLGAHKTMVTRVQTGDQFKKTNFSVLPPEIKLDRDFGFFVGMFLAEGSMPGDAYVSISSMNKERKAPVSRFAESIGLKPSENDAGISIHSRRLVEFMKRHCYATEKTGFGKGSGAVRKCVPDFCFFAPADFILGVLSGVFSGDGSFVNAKPSKGMTKGNLKIGLTTISPHLAHGIIELLSLTGVFALLRKGYYVYKGEKRVKYEVTALGNNASRLLGKIKLVGKPAPVIGRFSEKDAMDSLPCTKLLYDTVRELGYSEKKHADCNRRRAFAAMMRTVKSRGKIGRRKLERAAAMLSNEAELQKNERAMANIRKILKILGSSIVWDEVISAEEMPSAEKYVYDLSVDGNETFMTNNIVVHNSMLLKFVSDLMPRGRYVSGSGVTGAGLTATVRKDEIMGGWLLEAGALILANKSVIAIDEFDKMSRDDQIAMHEAMSVETISIAKASIVATLPAQTAVLAGANPKLSRFDRYTPIIEQIQIPETLLSRFDLKFALLDRPDRNVDERLAEHIAMSRITPEMVEPAIASSLLKKYIAYAKQKITSVELTKESSDTLKAFYVEMRNPAGAGENAPVGITLRQYEALLRLAEASAKISLSSKMSARDAERSIRLMKYSLSQLGWDYESGKFDIDLTESGVSSTKRRKIHVITDIIDSLQKKMKDIPLEDVKAAAEEQGVANAEEIIDKMKADGSLFEVRHGFIKKV